MVFSRARRLSSEGATYPGAQGGVGRLEHGVSRPRVVVPAAIGLQVHGRELPQLPPVLDAVLEAAGLLFLAHLQPLFQQDHARIDNGLLDRRHRL
jgi:hypothetical protein